MLEDLPRIMFSLVAVLGMIGAGALIARRMGFAAPVALARKKRLSLVEVMPVDARRRIAIIKCDDKEHLILLGATGETLIASNIDCITEAEAEASETDAAQQSPAAFTGLSSLANKLRKPPRQAA